MSLHNLARELEKTGRGNDKMLVHMTPREVHGLQTLAKAHGGSLTINPKTGLAEAGWLDSILPMVAGAALTGLSGGIINPLTAGLIVGGGTGLATGSVEKGLMAGLGAYGGAGLTGGMMDTGAKAIADAGGSSAVNTAQAQGLNTALPEGYNAANSGFTPSQMSAGSQDMTKFINAENMPNLNATQLQGYTDVAQSGAYNPEDVIRSAGSSNASAGASGIDQFKAGAGQNFSSLDSTGRYFGENYGKMGAALAPVAAEASKMPTIDPNTGKPQLDEKYKHAPYSYSLSPNFQGYQPTPPSPAYRPTGLGYTGYAMGGMIPDNLPPGGLASLQAARDGYGATMTAGGDVSQFAEGGMAKKKRATYTNAAKLAAMDPGQYGVAELNNAKYAANMSGDFALPTRMQEMGEIPLRAAKGTYLKGGGDGMSDSIPATINGKQPARLADGEFVVPADVVSHLGNGSSDAGAKRLYAMMDKVRQARTGRKAQGKEINPNKFMPA